MNSGLLNSAEYQYFRDDVATVSAELLDFDQNLLRYEYFLKLYSEMLDILGEQFIADMSMMFSAQSRTQAYFLYFNLVYNNIVGYYAGYFAEPQGQRSIYDTMVDIMGNELWSRITYFHGAVCIQDPRTDTYLPGLVGDPTDPVVPGGPPAQVATPAITKGGATTNANAPGYPGIASITCATPGALIFYRINYTTSGMAWTQGVSASLAVNDYIESYATAEGMTNSTVGFYNNASVGAGGGAGGGGSGSGNFGTPRQAN